MSGEGREPRWDAADCVAGIRRTLSTATRSSYASQWPGSGHQRSSGGDGQYELSLSSSVARPFVYLLVCTVALFAVRASSLAAELPSEQLVLQRVSEISGLKVKKEVPCLRLNDEALRKEIDQMIELQLPKGYLDAARICLAKFGIIGPDLDLKGKLISAYVKMAIGFYSPATKRMILKDSLSPPVAEYILAHELTHALQDQYVNLEKDLSDRTNSDKVLALVSIVEGQAMMVAAEYAKRYMTQKQLAEVAASGALLQKDTAGIPNFIRETMEFPYRKGPGLCSLVVQRKGMKGLVDALRSPPRSSEQVLSPDKYQDKPDLPVLISFKDMEALPGKSFEYLCHDVMGEFSTELLLRQFLSFGEAKSASKGWGGDLWAAYTSPAGVLLVWYTDWDTEGDATEFRSAVAKMLGARYRTDLSGDQARTKDVSLYLEKKGRDVLLIDGPRETDVKALAAKVWANVIQRDLNKEKRQLGS